MVLMAQMSIHFLSFIGMMLGTSTGSLFCGSAFAFDLAARTLTLDCDACSSCGFAGTSAFIVISIDHILVCSIRCSDPRLRIVLTHGPDSNFNSIFVVLKTGRDF